MGFKEQKQSLFGIFGEVFGWSDTTKEQRRKTLHSHILLFIALFDRLISMLWSNSGLVRQQAQDELKSFMAKTMSSSYELIEEDFLHQDNKEKDGKNVNTSCRIIPTVVPNQTQ
jgi:hypothetical protein